MRTTIACAAAAVLGFSGAAQATASAKDAIPTKFIKLVNSSPVTVYPIIFLGKRDIDEWLQAYFQVGKAHINTQTYQSKKVYRTYVIEDAGMAPKTTLYVQVPLYSQRAAKPDGTKPDQYIDWWNGTRVLFYDNQAEVQADYKNDIPGKVTPLTSGLVWCRNLNAAGTACKTPHPLQVFASDTGLPPLDLSQLTEFTFGDAITANGAPYPFPIKNVGYNISSVDQVYLPIAMEPLGNPTIPYIGTVVSIRKFRTAMDKWLTANPGWPVYLPALPETPRIPGAYNVFAAAVDLTPPGPAVDAMRALYRKCNETPDNSSFCSSYREIVALLKTNFDKFQALACHDPSIEFDQAQVLKKFYGWVPFNEGCGAAANSLAKTVADKEFDRLHALYISMQYTQDESRFNPYVNLIHGASYLDMAAYAFSIDDAIGFQSYKGTGLIMDFAGGSGLDNTNKLDTRDRVTITLGAPKQNGPAWATYGICSTKPNTGQFEDRFYSTAFFPTKTPCRITLADSAGALYQFVIKTLPQSPGGLSTACPDNVSNPAFCQSQVEVTGPQQINIGSPD
jgi:hypothetical protein